MRASRVLIVVALFLAALAFVPAAASVDFKISTTSFLKPAFSFSRNMAQEAIDFFNFRRNAAALRRLSSEIDKRKLVEFQARELQLENKRLERLLELRSQLEPGLEKAIAARVIGRSANAWNRACLIDKGSKHGLHVNMAVVSGRTLIGKIAEVGPSVSKVLFITDPNAKIGVIVQRTRQNGVLYGTGGGCRIKYLSLDAELKPGDVVLTAGFGQFFPKGLSVGLVKKSWKEAGQIYQVADLKPGTDLSAVEEVLCVE